MPSTYESFSLRFLGTLLGTGGIVALCLGMLFFQYWLRDKRKQAEREDRRFELEMQRAHRHDEREATVEARVNDGVAAANAGPVSGGYIVADLDEQLRPLFHDLLKGFEDFARLKGYHLSFSIDSTVEGKIAFKFTVRDDGVVVGQERVRRDFREYLEQVQNKDIEALDDLPVITSLEEHGLLVTLLKNRISFLQHSYKLSQTTIAHYENLLNSSRTFPAFPAPSVFVQTGGSMDSRSFSAVNSQKVLQGDSNTLTDNSINIGRSFVEKQQRIGALDEILQHLKAVPNPNEHTAKAELALIKVKDELSEEAEPNTPAIKRWLETAKNSLGTAALGYEAIEAGRKLFELFGIT